MNAGHWFLDTSDLQSIRTTVTSHGDASVLITEAPEQRWREDAAREERLFASEAGLVLRSYLARAEDDLDL